MKICKKINIFDLDTYIENNKKLTEMINKRLNQKGLSIRALSRKTGLSHNALLHFLKGASINSKNLEKIINFLRINKISIDKLGLRVYSGRYKFRRYNIRFPIKLNPLHIRVISHFMGDCALETHGCRWYQQSNVGGRCIIKLIKHLSGVTIKKGNKDSYGIPIILGDMVGFALDLNRNDLKSSLFIKKVNCLPKEYKLQLLAAIIVDEGHINKSLIRIDNTNLKLLQELKNMIDSLGYTCSTIKTKNICHKKKIVIRGRIARINYDLHSIWIRADGLLKFRKDLDKMINKHGNIASLWHKQKDITQWSNKVDLDKLKKARKSKKDIIPLIKKEIKKNPIKVSKFASEQGLDYFRAYKLFFRLKQKGEIKKISVGTFASNLYDGPTNLTLKSKIEELLLEGRTNVNDIVTLTGGNIKSVSAQLSKLCKEGKIKRIKQGLFSKLLIIH